MWFDLFIYSFSAIVAVVATCALWRCIKPQTFSQRIIIPFIGFSCGMCSYFIVLLIWLIVTVTQIL